MAYPDKCYVCHSPFNGNIEIHHVVPRAYGGLNGPTVALCDSCHTRVHKLEKLICSNKTDTFGLDKEAYNRLYSLALVIVRAKRMMKDDPNKVIKVILVLNQKEVRTLDKLKSMLGLKNRSDVYSYALKCLTNSLLPKSYENSSEKVR